MQMEVIQRCFKTHAYFLLNFSPNCTTTISLAHTIKLYRYEKGPNHFHSIFVILTTVKIPIFFKRESPLGGFTKSCTPSKGTWKDKALSFAPKCNTIEQPRLFYHFLLGGLGK